MADKEPWIGKSTFPRLFIHLCILVNILGIAALIILIITEFIILVNNYQSYVARYGYHYAKDGYLGDYGCGYAEFTNAPKHLGSAIWMLFFQLGLIVLCTLAISSDLSWRKTSYNKYGGRYVEAFYAGGIMPGSQNVHIYYFVIANAMLKLYILVLYMSQSFYGLNGGTHRDSSAQVYYTPGSTGVIYDSANAYVRHNTDHWKRTDKWNNGNYGDDGHDSRGDWAYFGLIGDRTPIRGMESFAFNMGWVLLATILPSVIAFMFLSAETAKKQAEAKPAEA